ncbi:hypothetical protein [Mycobacterium sp. 1274761.0]|uniref:hypothetical protein n=1 Tax=Mycobacterium sp. 1274761.0 TaxID=1834077 RepID=UPI0018D3BCC3|nr:hypothetical protein [Mycobacterium sp. 1274761.0]
MSALRVAACAGVLAGTLMLGYSTAGIAFAEPEVTSPTVGDQQDSKPGDNEAVAQIRLNGDGAGGQLQGEGTKDPEGAKDAGGTAGGSGGNTVVRVDPEPRNKPTTSGTHKFPFYVLDIRRDGGEWWSANQIISRTQQVFSPFLAAPTPPQPEPVPGPAFRSGGAPEPEPVLDASGGVVPGGGGSGYHGNGFGPAQVLSAPVVVAPVAPPSAARFPAFPPIAPPVPGIGSGAARGLELAPSAQGGRTTAAQGQTPPNDSTVRALTAQTAQTPRQGYTDYLRSPTLTQLTGAALPGVAAILLMTFGGGVIGYRQAEAGRMIRVTGAARYLP